MNADSIIPPHRCASFWKRLVAYGYDSLIVAVVSGVLRWQLSSVADAQTVTDIDHLLQAGALTAGAEAGAQLMHALGSLVSWWDLALPVIVSAIYNTAFIAGHWQATPGKRFCGIYVLRADGDRLSIAQSALRHATSGLSMLVGGVGYLTICFTRDKTAPHDMLCSTRVVTGKIAN